VRVDGLDEQQARTVRRIPQNFVAQLKVLTHPLKIDGAPAARRFPGIEAAGSD
jgi:hypothetical protein